MPAASDLRESPVAVARDLGADLKRAEHALKRVHAALRDRDGDGEFFRREDAQVLREWAAQLADLAESVKRQV